MQPISRRALFAASVAVILASCSDDDERSAPSTSPTTPPPPSEAESASTGPASTSASTVLATTEPSAPPVELADDPFRLGVASGDPDPTSVVLWTRLAPDPLNGGGMPVDEIDVVWEVCANDDFDEIANTGSVVATAADGHSVHVVAELPPGQWRYRFRAGGHTSPIGSTRAAPAIGEATDAVRFAAATCQHWEAGYYAAHRDLVEQAPEFVVWLGDYIYEGAGTEEVLEGRVRTHGVAEPISVEGYRDRYALYRSDPLLQAAHAACPWFVIWDDHEVENNYAGRTPQDPAETDDFPTRRLDAYRAWWEHMPVRLAPPTSAEGDYRVHRDARWGDLIGLALLDGRQYRSDQACGDVTLSTEPPCPEVTAPGRTMLGEEQEAWLYDVLGRWGTTWNALANQVVLTDVTLNGSILNYDQWDGYPEQRARIFEHLADQAIPNFVALTGDIHLAGVGQLRVGDPASGSPIGTEFVSTSISSSGNVDPALEELLRSFPSLVDVELAHRGYVIHDVTQERWTAEYRIVDDVLLEDSPVTVYQRYVVDAGTNTPRIE